MSILEGQVAIGDWRGGPPLARQSGNSRLPCGKVRVRSGNGRGSSMRSKAGWTGPGRPELKPRLPHSLVGCVISTPSMWGLNLITQARIPAMVLDPRPGRKPR